MTNANSFQIEIYLNTLEKNKQNISLIQILQLKLNLFKL